MRMHCWAIDLTACLLSSFNRQEERKIPLRLVLKISVNQNTAKPAPLARHPLSPEAFLLRPRRSTGSFMSRPLHVPPSLLCSPNLRECIPRPEQRSQDHAGQSYHLVSGPEGR